MKPLPWFPWSLSGRSMSEGSTPEHDWIRLNTTLLVQNSSVFWAEVLPVYLVERDESNLGMVILRDPGRRVVTNDSSALIWIMISNIMQYPSISCNIHHIPSSISISTFCFCISCDTTQNLAKTCLLWRIPDRLRATSRVHNWWIRD